MKGSLIPLSASLFTLVHSHIVFKPDNEIGLLFFGTSKTDNALYDEMKKRRKKGEYQHVKEIKPLDVPDVSYLTAVENIEAEDGPVDYVNALTVALDCMKRRLSTKEDPTKYTSRILIFSDFVHEAAPAKAEFSALLEETIEGQNIRLEAFVLDVGPRHGKREEKDIQALFGLERMNIPVRLVTTETELYSLFPTKPVASATMYRGPFEIGDMMNILVRVYKKTSRETLPSLKPYSSRKKAASATHEVVRDVEYKKRSDPSEPIPTEYHARGYIYGIQYVPVSPDIEKQLEYTPVKGMRLVGFVPRQQIPRHHYMKDTFIILPETTEESQIALSALAQQCVQQEKVAVVQCALRKGSSVFLGVMSPFIDRDRHQDTFLMNVAPFADDVREFTFGSFSSKESLMPTEEQMQIMSQIVVDEARMELDPKEQLHTDRTSNPLLHRFHRFLGKRSFEDPEEDVLSKMVFPSDCDRFGKHMQETLDASVHLFKKQKTQKATDE